MNKLFHAAYSSSGGVFMERPKFFYVTYPLPIEMADEFPMPQNVGAQKKDESNSSIPLSGEKDFEPVWYGNARFPEDPED